MYFSSVRVPWFYKLDKNSVNAQKHQFENRISESILCVYLCVDIFLLEKVFSLKFSTVNTYQGPFSINLSSSKQSIQNLGPYQ